MTAAAFQILTSRFILNVQDASHAASMDAFIPPGISRHRGEGIQGSYFVGPIGATLPRQPPDRCPSPFYLLGVIECPHTTRVTQNNAWRELELRRPIPGWSKAFLRLPPPRSSSLLRLREADRLAASEDCTGNRWVAGSGRSWRSVAGRLGTPSPPNPRGILRLRSYAPPIPIDDEAGSSADRAFIIAQLCRCLGNPGRLSPAAGVSGSAWSPGLSFGLWG